MLTLRVPFRRIHPDPASPISGKSWMSNHSRNSSVLRMGRRERSSVQSAASLKTISIHDRVSAHSSWPSHSMPSIR